jgi:hypothetical protein
MWQQHTDFEECDVWSPFIIITKCVGRRTGRSRTWSCRSCKESVFVSEKNSRSRLTSDEAVRADTYWLPSTVIPTSSISLRSIASPPQIEV